MDEAAQAPNDRVEQRGGERLDFVEDHDAAGGAVELAAGVGAVGEERFEEADVGSDDEGGVPVFEGEAVVLGFVLWVEFGVVFQDDVAANFLGERCKDGAEDVGVLLDDAGEGDDEDDAPVAVFQSVAQSEE